MRPQRKGLVCPADPALRIGSLTSSPAGTIEKATGKEGYLEMGMIGKLVGGTIGFALGGPLGAVAGAVFGHIFDQGNQQLMEDGRGRLSGIEETQLAFFVAAFSMLAKLVKADGRIASQELAEVEQFARFELGLDSQSLQVAMNIFNTALNSPAAFEDFARQFYQLFYNQPQMLEMMVDILFRVSVADGSLSPVEKRMIDSAAEIFRLSSTQYQAISSKYVSSKDQPYEILGCKPSDSDSQIKQRYRQLVQTYHPDKIAGKGLPDEFIQLAEEKFRQIQEAYEAIKAERGMH